MPANLLITQGTDDGLRFDLREDVVTIGRGVRCDVRLNDAEASRTHAIIRKNEPGFQLVDDTSANGTLVNGRPIQSHDLKTGDQIQIGRTVLVFDAGEGASGGWMTMTAEIVFSEGETDQSQIVHRIGPEDTRTYVRPDLQEVPTASVDQLSGLQTLYRVSEEAANATASQEQMLQTILDLTLNATQADRGCVLLVDAQNDRLVPMNSSTRDKTQLGPIMLSRTIVNHVANERQGVRTSDAQSDTRFATGNSIIVSGIREAICVPMMGLADFIGVIYLDRASRPDQLQERIEHEDVLTDEHLKLVLAVGRQAAIALERRRYQQALVKAERFAAVGQTITMLSHHVKNILQGVRGGSYLIQTGLDQSDEEVIRQGWGIVDRNQDRIYNLVMDMLTYSTEKKPSLETSSLNTVVGEVCELMKGRAAEYEVALEFEPTDNVPESAFDPHGIHRAVLNVVTNAIEAVEGTPDALVAVSTCVEQDGLFAISVRDNGPGIPQEQRDNLFNLFESTKGNRGTGLGLAVSRKIMDEHGGRIDVQSDADGTLFRLLLPVLDTGEAASEQTMVP